MKKKGAFERVLEMAKEAVNPAMDNLRLWAHAFGFGQPEKMMSPAVSGATVPTPTPTPDMYNTIFQHYKSGFQKYGNPPIATQAANLARVGLDVYNKGGDPYLPGALTIKETSGLKDLSSQKLNNPAGIGPGIQYPSIQVGILGGGTGGPNGQPQKGLRGVLKEPQYNKYYQSGNLLDFFSAYTPAGPQYGNADYATQISTINEFLDLFKQ